MRVLLFLMNTNTVQYKQHGTTQSWDTTQYQRKVLNAALQHDDDDDVTYYAS